jgi:hypothetical protein
MLRLGTRVCANLSELVILIEPEDRFAPAPLRLCDRMRREFRKPPVRGASVLRLRRPLSPLRGAFDSGAFSSAPFADPFFKKKHLDWLKICAEKGA